MILFSDYLKQLEEKIYLASNIKNNNLEYKKQNILIWEVIEYIVDTNKIKIKKETLNNLKKKIFLYNVFNENVVNNNIRKNLIHIEKIDFNNQSDVKHFIESILSNNGDIVENIKTILENETYLTNLLDSNTVFDYFMNNFIKIFDF